jgi:GNAT superfamily N-acetyltransferase
MLSAPQPLADHHQIAEFDSGELSLNDWLKRRAAKNQANGSSRTYVVCGGPAQLTVIGYYCLAAGAIGHGEAPSTLKRNRPDPIPVLVLGRLAIHKDHHQKGIGTALLNDAIRRAIQAANIAGVTALLVHAISEQARRFYLSRGFIESPLKPMTLCLMLATVEQALREP